MITLILLIKLKIKKLKGIMFYLVFLFLKLKPQLSKESIGAHMIIGVELAHNKVLLAFEFFYELNFNILLV